jgi:hypothetical protein
MRVSNGLRLAAQGIRGDRRLAFAGGRDRPDFAGEVDFLAARRQRLARSRRRQDAKFEGRAAVVGRSRRLATKAASSLCDDAVEDRVGKGGNANQIMPAVHGNLARQPSSARRFHGEDRRLRKPSPARSMR